MHGWDVIGRNSKSVVNPPLEDSSSVNSSDTLVKKWYVRAISTDALAMDLAMVNRPGRRTALFSANPSYIGIVGFQPKGEGV